MKRILIPLEVILIFISFSYIGTNKSLYSLIDNTEYKIANNELYYVKENTKENYSGSLTIIDRDHVNNKEELYSMFYTVLNNGYDIYTFKCSHNYSTCLTDLDKIDQDVLTTYNSLVNPKNSFKTIKTSYTNDKKITLNIEKKYTDEELTKIDNELDRLIVSLKINSYPDIKDKIKVFHDYIADHNVYDSVRAQTGESNYHSNTAIGALFEGYAICDGYSDALSFFLDKLDLENVKVTNKEHVWNIVKINDEWLHIDLTWDDPIYTNGTQLTIHDYFLITTDKLESKEDNEHSFDEKIYDFIK
ncbi:MAG: hypothetical protein IKZ96_02495 [Bacilli bacterium]|nr:hypothetical protein [Bacilli bacterium]